MRVAILSDLHLGYPRFEEDSYVQAERAVVDASSKADLVLCAGDIFDTKVPKLETLKKAIDIFGKASAPVFAIHGNHERRPRDMVNPAQLLAAGTRMALLHGRAEAFSKGDEKVQVFGMGSVPEEYAADALSKALGGFVPDDGAFRILMIHQSIKELIPGGKDELSLEHLEGLPFDLIVNGHIHETAVKLGGRFIMPGSTVITQLKKDETAPKGYFLYDTAARKAEFVEIESRKFFYETLEFKDAGDMEVREAVRAKIGGIRAEHPDAVIALKIEGTLKEGLSGADVKVDGQENVFIDNRLNAENLGSKLERIRTSREAALSLRELAIGRLREQTAGKVTMFDAAEIFDKLLAGPEETLAYLEKQNKKDEQQ